MKMKLYPIVDSKRNLCGFHWDYEFQYLDEVTYGLPVEIEVPDKINNVKMPIEEE